MRHFDDRAVTALVARGFLDIFDQYVDLTGLSRSDIIRQALVEHMEARGQTIPVKIKRHMRNVEGARL